jgi:Plasmid pRiA4b ORF-3-like protein
MPTPKSVFPVKISLADIDPPVWRKVEVPDCTLSKLHSVIQACMGWNGYHLWAFEIGGEQYGDDPTGEMVMLSARKVKLSQLAEDGVKKFRYVYDFGDNWTHTIEIYKAIPADSKVKYPRCVEGSRACPPEDCSGSWGYGDLLEAIKNPKHEQHDEMIEWLGDEFDPEAFDLSKVNKVLTGVG